jgi:hypothetical protein
VGVARLLLIPSFTELEWGIRPALEQWAELIAIDTPGMGEEPMPAGIGIEPGDPHPLHGWREAAVDRALEEVDRRGCERRREAIAGLALGHASLSHSSEGERPPFNGEIWDALTQLARQGNEAFVRYGIAQMTRGGVSEEQAEEMIRRFPRMDLVIATIEAIGNNPEPIGDQLAALGLPLLLAKHEGCLGRTDEGFEDIVAAFPEADTVICPETCSSSPAFAQGLREFCAGVE